MWANMLFFIPSHTAKPVVDIKQVSTGLILMSTQISWKTRNSLWKFHKVPFCVPVLFVKLVGTKYIINLAFHC